MGTKPFILEYFQNVLCIPFIKRLIIYVIKAVQMNLKNISSQT